MVRDQDFYIGYSRKAPEKWKSFLTVLVLLIVLGALSIALLNHFFREPHHAGVSGSKVVKLKGVLIAKPYPMLLVERVFDKASSKARSAKKAIVRYYVTPPGKKGLGKAAQKWHRKYVSMKGKLIYREDQTMIVAHTSTIEVIKNQDKKQDILKKSYTEKIGRFTLRGEIVDSKCFLGQMKPGSGKPHRACATLCIRGGLPPLFVVSSSKIKFNRTFLVLVSRSNRPVNQAVLNVVAEPVEITGDVIKKDNLYFLKAEPSTYKRLSSI